MTKSNFTFTNLAEAEEAWETMRNLIYLQTLIPEDMASPYKAIYKGLLDTMDRIAQNVKENSEL